MTRIKKLIGEKIALSPITFEDIPKMVEGANDFAISDGNGVSDFVVSDESFRRNVEADRKNEKPHFAIIKNDTEEVIGFCRMSNFDFINKVGTVTISIDKSFQNLGYAQEALNLLLDYSYNYLNLNNIMLTVFSFNTLAIKCYTKVGFKEFGRRTKSRYLNGKWYDIIFMEILKDDFKGDYIKNKINY